MASPWKLRRAIASAAALALSAGLLTGLGAVPSVASSHREAPLISADPQADNTDTYAFVSPDNHDMVTIIGNWIPFETPAGGPNFYPWANNTAYDFNIDNNGDARPDIIYRWVFSSSYLNPNTFLYNTGQVTSLNDPDLNFRQTYTLSVFDAKAQTWTTLLSNAPAVPSDVGDASMPNYGALSNSGIAPFSAGGDSGNSWAGQADDPFFLDLRVFDLLYGGNLSEVGHDSLAGFNVNSIALQVPKSVLARNGDVAGNPVIGVWSTTSRPQVRLLKPDGSQVTQKGFIQISRLGNPLVNEVVVPVGMKDRFNASQPKNDAQFLSSVTNPEVPALIQAIYGIPAPATPRNDLVSVFLTGVSGLNQPPNVTPSEEMRLNMSINPGSKGCKTFSRLGVIGGDNCGYPNGRRLQDDVIDITLRVAEGWLVGQQIALGDGVDANDLPFRTAFPYLALPTSGSSTTPRG